MKLILFWLYLTSARAITTPLWSIYANSNLQPEHLYPHLSNYYQQLQNNQNSGQFFRFTNNIFQPSVILPQQNVRFLQTLGIPISQTNLPLSNQAFHNPGLFNIRPYQSFIEYSVPYNSVSIQNEKKKSNGNIRKNNIISKKKRKSKLKTHTIPTVHINNVSNQNTYPDDIKNNEQAARDYEIPTKPIYPGEGQWAKRGKKHRPHVTKHEFKDLKDTAEYNMGHEIFDESKANFEEQRNKVNHDLQHFPEKHNLDNNSQDCQDSYNSDDSSTEEFVPYKTYSQVRQSESEKNLPPPPEDERLTEAIKDSKVHTVYTEEGYEDSAYDHADQEKKADSTEIYSDVKNRKVKSKFLNNKDNPKFETKKNLAKNITKSENLGQTETIDRVTDLLGSDQNINSKTKIDTPETAKDNVFLSKKHKEILNFKPHLKEINKKYNKRILPNNHEVNYISYVKGSKSPHFPVLKRNKSVQISPPGTLEKDLIDDVKFGNKININLKSNKKLNRKRRMTPDDVSQKKISNQNGDKYPYYNIKSVEENSPLRYSENLSKIPDKKPGVMAFYNQIDETECGEVEKDINPIAERLSHIYKTTEPKDVETSSSRLGKLGDKIDCFKAKYFGENPLDNPLFEEDSIEPPRTIFKSSPSPGSIDTRKSEDNVKTNNKSEDKIAHIIEDYISYESTENVKGQIEEDDRFAERIEEKKISDIILGRFLRESASPNLKYKENSEKLKDRLESVNVPKVSRYVMKRRRKPYRSTIHRTSVSPVIYNSYAPSHTTHKPFSEVHYKDEIKTSEQLNVFADIINNIKNASKEFEVPSVKPAPVDTVPNRIYHRRRKVPIRNNKVKTTNSPLVEITTNNVLNSFLSTSISPSKHNNFLTENQRYYLNTIDDNFSKIDSFKDNPLLRPPMIIKQTNIIEPVEMGITNVGNTLPSNHRIEETTNGYEIHGLLPPKEVYSTQQLSLSNSDITSNNFHVIGMRPPPIKNSKRRQNHVKKRRVSYPYRRRIVKRSSRRGYAEIRREARKLEQNAQQEEEEEYIPHRPKTYYYDIEKGRIVYNKKPENKEEIHESYEYVDVVEEVTQPSKPKKEKKEERVLKFPDKPPEGPTYIDFITLLKTNPSYHEIPDPKSTEKITSKASTETPMSTTEPEFLGILAKVRSDAAYKPIVEEKKPNAEKEKVSEEEGASAIEEEEVSLNVKNSPGGQNNFSSSHLQIFDISEYLPKVKNYSPSTNIDTSKYKSIERVTITRHNSNTQYISEDEKIEHPDVEATSSHPLSLQTPTTTDHPTISLPKTEKLEERIRSRKTTSRGRRRPTTTQAPVEEAKVRSSAKLSSRGRSRFRSTTSNPADELRKSTRKRRNLQRKYEKNAIPRNHKSYYSSVESDGLDSKMKEIVTSRTITIDTLEKTNITSVPKAIIVNETGKTDDIDIFKEFNRTQRHGGNYKYKEIISEGINFLSPTTSKIEDFRKVKRLTDVVQKPFAFYSDPKLPSRINSLTGAYNRNIANEGPKYELDFFEDAIRVNSESTTRKPVFIKDPSKRLYFYAPV